MPPKYSRNCSTCIKFVRPQSVRYSSNDGKISTWQRVWRNVAEMRLKPFLKGELLQNRSNAAYCYTNDFKDIQSRYIECHHLVDTSVTDTEGRQMWEEVVADKKAHEDLNCWESSHGPCLCLVISHPKFAEVSTKSSTHLPKTPRFFFLKGCIYLKKHVFSITAI